MGTNELRKRDIWQDSSGGKAGIAEKNFFQSGRGDLQQQRGKINGRSMGEPSEHHVGHVFELIADGLIENGVVVTMDGGPPGRHAVDEFPPVFQNNADAGSRGNRIDRERILHGGIRMPEMFPIESDSILYKTASHCSSSHESAKKQLELNRT